MSDGSDRVFNTALLLDQQLSTRVPTEHVEQ